MLIPIGSKQVQISTLGQDDNILVNQSTGEVNGTHVVAYKRVDKQKFVKTFADYMAFTFDLTKAGNKALRVAMWAVKEHAQGKDVVALDKLTLADFLKSHQHIEPPLKITLPTFNRGLGELVSAKIIAKTIRIGSYYINPDVMFNGSRVAFSTVIEHEDIRKGDTHLQQELLSED